jgi:GNAT superfamily N-acetyltransferase
METGVGIKLRLLSAADLDRANAVIEAAIMTWDLPERVKRLSLPSYRYDAHDLDHLTLMGAEDEEGAMVGVAAWEPASISDTPNGASGLLLHGIYAIPARHRTGVGSRLLDAAVQAACHGRFDGLLVKSNPDAQGFFESRDMQRLSTEDARRDYPYRFWMDLKAD